jgi:hypothetical protein
MVARKDGVEKAAITQVGTSLAIKAGRPFLFAPSGTMGRKQAFFSRRSKKT